MTRWEYLIVDSKDVAGGGLFKGKERPDVEAYLNNFGNEGWELVNLVFRELDHRFEFTGIAKRERVT